MTTPITRGRLMTRRRLLTLAAPALLLTGLSGCGYNTIQTYDEEAASAKQQIEVQLKRRADLIPNLVSTVKGFAAQEEKILTRVADAQRGLTGALNRPGGTDPRELAQANDNLNRALVPVFTLVTSYPQLASNEQFLRLQDELTGTENRIATARTDYNGAVQRYNTYIRQFPAALTAKVTGAKPRAYFEVPNAGDREAPTVDFSQPPATGTTPPAGAGTPPKP
jgi:LemA protein